MRFILSCKNNIGDVIATLPMAGLLKQHYPGCKVILLAKNYVKDLVPCCLDIDIFLPFDEITQATEDKAIQLLKSVNANCCIHAISDKKIAYLVKKSGIPIRIGTVRRWYHFLYCNRIIWASRRNPLKHEAQFNVRMLSPLHIPYHYTGEQLIPYIRLSPTVPAPPSIVEKIATNRFNIVIHPGTNNHTKEWPIHYFQKLIAALPADQFNIFLTGTDKDSRRFKTILIDLFPQVHNVMGMMTVSELVSFLSLCDGALVGSTGPVHINAALGNPTLGLYPAQVGRNANRWRPLGAKARYLVALGICSLCAETPHIITNTIPGCTCMETISVEAVKEILDTWAIKTYHPIHIEAPQ